MSSAIPIDSSSSAGESSEENSSAISIEEIAFVDDDDVIPHRRRQRPHHSDDDDSQQSSSSSGDRAPRSYKRQRQRSSSSSSTSDDSSEISETPFASKPQNGKCRDTTQSRAPADGGGTLHFEDDGSGKKTMKTLTMRYALQIMDEEAKRSAQSVAQRLMRDGNKDESKTVQVRSGHHAKVILTKVREKLREVKIPKHYVRLDDMNVNTTDLGKTNDDRRTDLQVNRQLVRKLRKQRNVLQKEFDDALAERNRAYEEVKTQKQGEQTISYPLLDDYKGRHVAGLLPSSETQSTVRAQRRPSGPSLHSLLQSCPSP